MRKRRIIKEILDVYKKQDEINECAMGLNLLICDPLLEIVLDIVGYPKEKLGSFCRDIAIDIMFNYISEGESFDNMYTNLISHLKTIDE